MTKVPEHLFQAAVDLETAARKLLPEVLALTDRYDVVEWSFALQDVDLEHCEDGVLPDVPVIGRG